MPDWSASMEQTFEYYIVDPISWGEISKITTVKSSSISRDLEADTLGSASFDITEAIGECYIRIYLITVQKGVTERFSLGTFLVQTPSFTFDGKLRTYTIDAYTPLLELKEKLPPIGYFLEKGQNIMDWATTLTTNNVRAPVIEADSSKKLTDNFVAESEETWLTYIKSLISCASYRFDLDEKCQIGFAPIQDISAMNPRWTYDDGNSSILYPEITIDRDLYGIPNVVEVIYSSGSQLYSARIVNNDKDSPISTVKRGREIVHRVVNPEMNGDPNANMITEYATQLLKSLSSIDCTVSYTHGYCPVRVGDCVRLNYERAGLTDIKAKVISQTIKCESGCPVTEKAAFIMKLWE